MDVVMMIDRKSLFSFNSKFKALWTISALVISFLLRRLSCSKNRHSLLLVFHTVPQKQKYCSSFQGKIVIVFEISGAPGDYASIPKQDGMPHSEL